MRVLFSPSEAKYRGGSSITFDRHSFIFNELFDKRLEIVELYNSYMLNASIDEKMKILGTKKQDVLDYYSDDIFSRSTKKVIERYDGVAYDYLNYDTLNKTQKKYIDQNVIIFSNLFGPIQAGDSGLPDYKLKQGEKIGKIAPERFYKEHFSNTLDEVLASEHYLDLRAGFYNKFYKPSSPYTTLKFIKEGKVVSHWAKAYRGIVLREIAKANIQTIGEFMKMNIENLMVKEIIEKGIHTEIVYAIVNTSNLT
jgi:cytoplasmic iron level regulating protein YaaA (DUF328/UPF0246 family)